MKKLVSAVIFIFIICLTSQNLFSQEFVIGVGDYDYLPHHAVVNNEYVGFAREVLDLFALKSGYTFKYKPMPWKRVMTEFVANNVDFVFPDNPYWSGEDKEGFKVIYSDSVVQYIDGVVVLPNNKNKGINSIKKLGTLRGFTPWDYYDQIESGSISVIETSNFTGLLNQVIGKRVDAAYIEISVAQYYLDKVMNKQSALVFNSNLPHTKGSYYLSTIKYSEILEEFNRFLVNEKNSIDALKRKHKVGKFTP